MQYLQQRLAGLLGDHPHLRRAHHFRELHADPALGAVLADHGQHLLDQLPQRLLGAGTWPRAQQARQRPTQGRRVASAARELVDELQFERIGDPWSQRLRETETCAEQVGEVVHDRARKTPQRTHADRMVVDTAIGRGGAGRGQQPDGGATTHPPPFVVGASDAVRNGIAGLQAHLRCDIETELLPRPRRPTIRGGRRQQAPHALVLRRDRPIVPQRRQCVRNALDGELAGGRRCHDPVVARRHPVASGWPRGARQGAG